MIYVSGIMIYLFALVAVGIYKIRSVKDSEDFMVAGRTLPWYILVGTLLATWMGSGSLFSGAGLGYRNGLAGLWSCVAGNRPDLFYHKTNPQLRKSNRSGYF